MVTISCSAKLHAFALAEQLDANHMLDDFYTTYASGKNTWLQHFVKRQDKENIRLEKIHTNGLIAFPVKFWQAKVHIWNDLFDRWVARKIRKSKSKIFIGWSGMSLHSIRAAKKAGMITIVERGSSHIQFQNEILKQEYERYGLRFYTHPDIIKKELQEYAEADYISVPSTFVKKTFLEKGVPEKKLILNLYGVNTDFILKSEQTNENTTGIFKILYLGTLSYRKGLPYLFQAIHSLDIPLNQFEVCFIGDIDKGFKKYCDQYKKENWTFLGHIDHYELPRYLQAADVGVIPSVEDGFGMVIPQIMAGGVPVITTTNTGASDLISEGVNGFVVPVRDPQALARKIELLYHDPERLAQTKISASEIVLSGNTWADYGIRYTAFLKSLTGKMKGSFQKKVFLMLIYNHQEYYPPTLNAIDQLADISDAIIVVTRNSRLSSWTYPENTTLHTSGDFVSIRESEVESTWWKVKSFLQFTWLSSRLFRQYKPEWVICYDSIPLLSARILKWIAGAKFKLWYHNHDVSDSQTVRKYSIGWLAASSERTFFKHINLFTLPSRERITSFVLDDFKGSHFVVPNYPSKLRYGTADANRDLPSASLKLIFQGFIGGGHGLEEVIDFVSKKDSISFTIIGPGDQEYVKQLKELALQKNAAGKVIIREAIPYQLLIEVTRLHHIGLAIHKPVNIQYSTAALASNKIYEYAACGLPVIYFDDEHYISYLSRFPWAFANNLSFERLDEQCDFILEHYAEISSAAARNFREGLNFERVFCPVKEFLLKDPE
jgi:glycosyltransferase involved in cell wall biosynthesis